MGISMEHSLHELVLDQEDYPCHSRIHPLKALPNCYIKRDDELGCVISGCKVRKFRSLVRAIKKKNHQKVGLIGSQYSNHVLGLTSLLLENGIEPTLFLLESLKKPLVGNAFFIELLVAKTNIHLIKRSDWHAVEQLAYEWQAKNNAFIVPEGGVVDDAIPGLITLALDILQNEKDNKITFNEILIDSGTGLTAAVLIACYALLEKKAVIHVCLTAPVIFTERLRQVCRFLERLTGKKITHIPEYILHEPPTARSFGSVNATIIQTITSTARREGLFLDPIYSSKLYILLQKLISEKRLLGPTLFIHSGGVLSLSGFQDELYTAAGAGSGRRSAKAENAIVSRTKNA